MKHLLVAMAAMFASSAYADDVFPPEWAFPFYLAQRGNQVHLIADIRQGFALYRDRLVIKSKDVKINDLHVPAGKWVNEPDKEQTEIFTGHLDITFQMHPPSTKNPSITVMYQGCKIDDYCYPPIATTLPLSAP